MVAMFSRALRLNRPVRVCGIPSFARQPCRWYSVPDNYKKKLEERAEKEGISVEELVSRSHRAARTSESYDPLGLVEKAHRHAEGEETPSTSDPAKDSARSAIESAARGHTEQQTKELGAYVDVDKLKQHNAKEIEMIWKARFLNKKDEFSGSMTAEAFSRLYVNARKYPQFVLPLPDKDGVGLYFTQWSFVGQKTIHCLLTPLAEYKLHGEYATPHLTFMIHSNFVADRGIALTNTSILDQKLDLQSAALLTLTLQRFYTAEPNTKSGAEKLKLLGEFNSGDENFSVHTLIAAADTVE